MNDQPAPDPLDFTPVPRKFLRRHDGWTVERQRRFIAALAECGSVSAAARQVGVSNSGAYNLYNHPDGASLRAAWDRALAMGCARIHDVAMERAIHGVLVPIFYKGEQVGEQRFYSDRVLTTLLRHHAFGHHPVGDRSQAARDRPAAENCPVCRERRPRRLKPLRTKKRPPPGWWPPPRRCCAATAARSRPSAATASPARSSPPTTPSASSPCWRS